MTLDRSDQTKISKIFGVGLDQGNIFIMDCLLFEMRCWPACMLPSPSSGECSSQSVFWHLPSSLSTDCTATECHGPIIGKLSNQLNVGSLPPPPSLVNAYYLHPPEARAIFLHNDLLCNDACSVTGGGLYIVLGAPTENILNVNGQKYTRKRRFLGMIFQTW